MARRQVGGECRAAELTVSPSCRILSTGAPCRRVSSLCRAGTSSAIAIDLRAGQLLHQRIAFLMIAVRVVAEQDLDVGELEPELLDRLLDVGTLRSYVLSMRMWPCGVTRNELSVIVPT